MAYPPVVPRAIRSWAMVAAFNAVLAGAIQMIAPAQPVLTDRNDYDYNSTQPLTAYCPNTVYCYRILVPMVLNRVPIDPERRWQATRWLATSATGTIVAMTASLPASPLLASMLLQTSYGFAYTAYDPYTPDPVIFLVAALIAYCWMQDTALVVALMATVMVLAKETVALLAAIPAIAVWFARERTARWRWLIPGALAWLALLSFHWYMDTYAGWGIGRLPSSDISTGSWFGIWWRNNPSHIHKALMVFAPFGFGWLFAALGYRHGSRELRQLALGAALPLLALVFVQAPDRALGNAFFIVIPLAAAFLAQVPASAAWTAAIINGLLTARMGLSTDFLPSSTILFVPAVLATAWTIAAYRRQPG